LDRDLASALPGETISRYDLYSTARGDGDSQTIIPSGAYSGEPSSMYSVGEIEDGYVRISCLLAAELRNGEKAMVKKEKKEAKP
jgi:hypothetical protein